MQSVARPLAGTHFGAGVLTFSVGYLFRTPPGVGLLVCGPPNTPKDGLFALTGMVETDWSHATFTMNYRFTRRGHWVEFAEGEPFCRIIPIDRRLLDQASGDILAIDDNPELGAHYRNWMQTRQDFNEALKNPFSEEAARGWQRDYFQGLAASGERVAHHQTQLHHKDFTDLRPGARPAGAAARPRPGATRRRPARESASDFLWKNTDLYDRRRQKTATVLAGIARLLRSKRPLADAAEARFLSTFERLQQLPPAQFTHLWGEPRAFHWTRTAFDLLDQLVSGATPGTATRSYLAQLGTADRATALALHLDGLRLFELGAAAAFARQFRWDEPLVLALPCAIPGTRWTLQGEGSAAIIGLDGSGLRLQVNAGEQELALVSGAVADSGLSVTECNTAGHADARLRLQPEAIAGLGLAEVKPALEVAPDFHQQAAPILSQALAATARFAPESFRLLADEYRVVAPKTPTGSYSNTTFSTLPGAMVLSVVANPLEMADRIVHELHHDRLFCIEDLHPLLEQEGEDPGNGERYYSPWREDPRPLRGILHGLYVYLAVGRFWLGIFQDKDMPDVPDDYPVVASERLRRILGQLDCAASQLESHAHFTPFGTGIFDQLRKDLGTLRAKVDASGVAVDPQALIVSDDGQFAPQIGPTGRPLTVSQALKEHRATASALQNPQAGNLSAGLGIRS